jgi:hypothetical protein
MSEQRPSVLDRRGLLNLVVSVCVLNGIFSPYLAIALQVAPILMPEMFPRTIGWSLFFASLMVSTATLLISGIPAAVYEHFFETDEQSPVSMWLWFAAAIFMTLPALQALGGLAS